MSSLPRTGLRRIALASALVFSVNLPAFAQKTLTLHTTREPGLIQPLPDSWTKTSGIKVNTVYIKDDMFECIKVEDKNSPTDLLMTVNADNLIDLVEAGVTQPVESETLKTAIPANLRGADNQWFALSMRARVLYAEKSLPIGNWHYEQFANPGYKGKVCICSGWHPYNAALIATVIAHHGEAKTKEWLRGVKASLVRKVTGGDRDVARDVLGGIYDTGLANSYYVDHMKDIEEGSDARQWGDAIKVVKSIFENSGTHTDISGATVTHYAPDKADTVKLMEYLVSASAQQQYAKTNFEYPVLRDVTLDPVISATIDEVDVNRTSSTEIVKYRKQVSLLVDKVEFDQ